MGSDRIYVDVASGEAGGRVLLTHGIADSSATWAGQVGDLTAEGWSTTVWDLPGHGRSRTSRVVVTRDNALAHLATLARPVTIEATPPPVLVGHSFGGYLSLACAILNPSCVRALVLIATGPGFRDPAARRRWNETVTSGRFARNPVAATLAVQQDSLVVDRLSSIDAPTLVIVGEHDKAYHRAADVFATKLGATVEIVPGAGHHVHRTHADLVNRVILRFLATLRRDGTTSPTRTAGSGATRA